MRAATSSLFESRHAAELRGRLGAFLDSWRDGASQDKAAPWHDITTNGGRFLYRRGRLRLRRLAMPRWRSGQQQAALPRCRGENTAQMAGGRAWPPQGPNIFGAFELRRILAAFSRPRSGTTISRPMLQSKAAIADAIAATSFDRQRQQA